MTSSNRFYNFGLVNVLTWLAALSFPLSANAQNSIVPDTTLGNSNSAVNFDNNRVYNINGGLEAGNNLFHSFSRFGLQNGEAANFASDAGTLNIITRVTGGTPSMIDGALQAGNVNLFIINPNGLTFAENASLNIGRSFIGSTASSLVFEDGTRLATGTATDFAGTASLPASLEIIGNAAPINVTDSGRPGFVGGDDGLAVNIDNTIGLIGGDVTLEGGIIQAPKGTLFLAALSAGQQVDISFDLTSGELKLDDINSADIPSSADGVVSLDNSILTANLDEGETGLAGVIRLIGDSILLDNRTQVQSVARAEGEPGLIELTTSSRGNVILNNNSSVFTTIENGGRFNENSLVGVITVSTGFLSINNGSQLLASVREAGDAGEPAGIGEPGNILIVAPLGVELRGQSERRADGTRLNAAIVTRLSGEGTGATLAGDGGNLLEVLTDPSGDLFDLFGSVLIFTDGDVVVDDNAFISTDTTSNGNAGAVYINANNVFVQDGGRIFSDASGPGTTGSAGTILIDADNDIVVRDENSRISSQVGSEASSFLVSSNDQNGAILLFSRRLGVLNGGEVSVDNDSSGEAGALLIGADLVALNRSGGDDAGISAAATGDATGGNIFIFGNSESNAFFSVLANGSEISTNTISGSGGDILISVFPEIIAAPSQDNNIVAESQDLNSAARVDVSFGEPFLRNIAVAPRGDSPLTNDISAASPTNVNGTVTTGGLEDSLLQDPSLLPADLIDPSRLIAQGCGAGDLTAAQNIGDLSVTGRSGLSATPTEQIAGAPSPTDLANLDTADVAQAEASIVANNQDEISETMADSADSDTENGVEAQTWRYGSNGTVMLMADASQDSTYSPVFSRYNCDAL